MINVKAMLSHRWFFPLLIFYYGILYFLFGETYPFNGGLSTDGYTYSSFIPDFTQSYFFNSFYVHRILPSLIVSAFFKLLSIIPSSQNIYTAFQILNLASTVLACYFLKQILLLFKISLKNQVLAFVLFLLNFGVIKYPFYLPVMTDTLALMLSTALLYFYFKNNLIGMVISTLLLAFTWPMAYYQGLLLIALPICILPFTATLKWQKYVIYGVSVLYIFVISCYYVFVEKRDMTVDFVMKIDRNLLPISILGIVLFYFFFAKIILNKTLFDVSLFIKKINYQRILISLIVFSSVSIIIYFLHPSTETVYTFQLVFRGPPLYSLIRPLITIVSHVSYFGILICLLLLFWKSFCKTVSQMGWGIVAAVGLNLFLFGISPESRQLINLFPWLVVFLIVTLNKYSFSTGFYIVVGVLSFVASKVWLLLNIYEGNLKGNFDENGCMDFPDQILWMNVGPWMSERMYFVQGAVMLIFIGILFLMLYKIEVNEFNKLKLVRKYKILK